MDTNTETSKVIIDPDGDVVLVLSDFTELQVSSKVLGIASSVFKAMFGAHFQEGQDLGGTSPTRISLPEDNPAAMATLCNVLHHRHNNVSKIPMETELVDIAVASDKYGCNEAFSLWSPTWMLHYLQTRSSDLRGVAQLVYPFFLLNDAESFKQVSKLTVLHSQGFIDKPKTTDLMPDSVFEVLRRKKQRLERGLCHDLEIILRPILNNILTSGGSRHSNSGDVGVRLSTHLKALEYLGVWPLSSALNDRSIASVCTILARYEEKGNDSHGCKCSVCSMDSGIWVRRAGSNAMESFKGLCLACIKLGDTGTDISPKCEAHKAADV